MNPDNELSDLLHRWQPVTRPADDFHRVVWSRIETAESRKSFFLSPICSWLQLLASPRVAVASLIISLLGGAFIGSLEARSSQEQRYLLSLSPYASNH